MRVGARVIQSASAVRGVLGRTACAGHALAHVCGWWSAVCLHKRLLPRPQPDPAACAPASMLGRITPIHRLMWEGCLTPESQLVWYGQRCGTDNSYIRWTGERVAAA